jgi:hypothetical protein
MDNLESLTPFPGGHAVARALVTAQQSAPSGWAGREHDERVAVRVGPER